MVEGAGRVVGCLQLLILCVGCRIGFSGYCKFSCWHQLSNIAWAVGVVQCMLSGSVVNVSCGIRLGLVLFGLWGGGHPWVRTLLGHRHTQGTLKLQT